MITTSLDHIFSTDSGQGTHVSLNWSLHCMIFCGMTTSLKWTWQPSTLTKAFDTIPHRCLMMKLRYYGVNSKVGAWMAGFLHNRSQQVVVDGEASSWAPVESRVPQLGTVLGIFIYKRPFCACDITSLPFCRLLSVICTKVQRRPADPTTRLKAAASLSLYLVDAV